MEAIKTEPLELPWINGAELRRIINANSKKAAGCDDWHPKYWALLPDQFFNCLAAIWNVILHCEVNLPRAWLLVRVCLLPKEEGGFRPLSIAVIAWRAGLSAILRRKEFRAWVRCWLTQEVAGGVPGASTEDIHEDLMNGIMDCIEDGELFAGAKVDLAKCFDRASASVGVEMCMKLGLPHKLGRLILHFYEKHVKTFRKRWHVCETRHLGDQLSLAGMPYVDVSFSGTECDVDQRSQIR